MITGHDLQMWGYKPGPWFRPALELANSLHADGCDEIGIRAALTQFAPPPVEYLQKRPKWPEPGALEYTFLMDADTDDERANCAAVREHMDELMRVPTIKAGAVMPDACPAGSAKGTIPVGGVVACENAIHPGFHSADICCSMAISTLPAWVDAEDILDVAMEVTHFGPGGRAADNRFNMPPSLVGRIERNPITAPLLEHAKRHFGTQGDGNHFFYAGYQRSTGHAAIVTHHGSRAFGARVYKVGQRIAETMTKKIAPSVPKHQAWIPSDSQEGRDYWEALQICREWTKCNHFILHDAVIAQLGVSHPFDRFWNEHNFVFLRDGLYYHAKGATPAFPGFARDTDGRTLIPMNMAEPILITRGRDAEFGLGFSPHGAGRNLSRTGYIKTLTDDTHLQASAHVDVRWFSGKADPSEMPGGYKNAESVRQQIKKFGLADVIDEITPYGCIMAGEIDWKRAGKELGDAA